MKNITEQFVIEFQNGNSVFYLAPWDGDPGRTRKIENAQHFKTPTAALRSLKEAILKNTHRKLTGRIISYTKIKNE